MVVRGVGAKGVLTLARRVPRMVEIKKRKVVEAIKEVAQARDTWPRNSEKFGNFDQKWFLGVVRRCDTGHVMASKIFILTWEKGARRITTRLGA